MFYAFFSGFLSFFIVAGAGCLFNAKAFFMSLSDKRLVVIMAGKYQLYKDKAGKYRFRLVAENGRTVATGEAYERRASCLNGIESLKRNSGSSIEDTTIDSAKIPFPKYQILVDKVGEFRFNLSASNGEVIASSEGYSSKDGCLNGINSVRRIANSEIEDLTTATGKQKEAPIMEPEPTVEEKKVEPSKQPAPEEMSKEEDNRMSRSAAAAGVSKEKTASWNEIRTKQKGNFGIAFAVLIVGLLVGFLLLAVGLGFGGFFASTDAIAKVVMQVFGELVICGSILFFFAKK